MLWTYKMALVVGFAVVITQKLERVVLSDMLRMVLYKLFGAIP